MGTSYSSWPMRSWWLLINICWSVWIREGTQKKSYLQGQQKQHQAQVSNILTKKEKNLHFSHFCPQTCTLLTILAGALSGAASRTQVVQLWGTRVDVRVVRDAAATGAYHAVRVQNGRRTQRLQVRHVQVILVNLVVLQLKQNKTDTCKRAASVKRSRLLSWNFPGSPPHLGHAGNFLKAQGRNKPPQVSSFCHSHFLEFQFFISIPSSAHRKRTVKVGDKADSVGFDVKFLR